MDGSDFVIEKKRAWHLTIYDLQGGPIPEIVTRKLEGMAEELAKEWNLAIESSTE